jgi:DNA-directed RNA polymerase I, II, and III subunit RPABC2
MSEKEPLEEPIPSETDSVDEKEQKDYMISSSSEEESDDEDNELKNLENFIDKNKLLQYHPEITQINYNELITKSKIIRDKNGIPIDPLHKTVPFLTKYEKARVLGLRAKQINNGGDIFVEVPTSIHDGFVIAQMELEQKKLPFIIRRPLPNGTSEYWSVNELQLL